MSTATPSVLSGSLRCCRCTRPTGNKQVALLEGVGYVHVKKGYVGKRPRTWLSLTPLGRERFTHQLATLRAIAERAVSATESVND